MKNQKVDAPFLVIGADGNIGKRLVAELEAVGKTVWQTTRRKETTSLRRVYLDLSEDVSKWTMPANRFDAVFLCASITSYMQCEKEPNLTWNANVVNTAALAKRFIDAGAFLIFLSSNAVFDGTSPNVNEMSQVNPRTIYGSQKATVEKELLSFSNSVAVVRLGKVITDDLSLFRSWINDLQKNENIYPFSDMVMAPVSLALVVKVLIKIAEKKKAGIFQISADNDIPYADACKYIADKLKFNIELVKPVSYKEKGISTSPEYTTFDCSSLSELGFEAPSPLQALDDFLLNF